MFRKFFIRKAEKGRGTRAKANLVLSKINMVLSIGYSAFMCYDERYEELVLKEELVNMLISLTSLST